jgi:predicted RNase H-like HicB family nuclease
MKDYHYLPVQGHSPATAVLRVVLEHDGQGWLAFCPELRDHGAATWCTTREAALRHIHELIEDIAAKLPEHGVPIPDDVRISITTS